MLPIPYLNQILGGGLVVALAFAGVQTVRLKMEMATTDALSANLEVCHLNVERAGQHVLTLRRSIDEQNAEIDAARELGLEAQAAMDKVAEYTRRLARAEDLLQQLSSEHEDLESRAADLSTCETYELVLRSIAGDLP